MQTLLSKSFAFNQEIEGGKSGKYKLISPSDGKCFLLLKTEKKNQKIILFNFIKMEKTLIKTLPLHPFVVSATISNDRRFLIIVFYSINNGFSKQEVYYSMCYNLYNSYVQFPIHNITYFRPQIDFGENSRKIYILINGTLETWNLDVTNDDFSLTRISRVINDVVWLETKGKQEIDYITKETNGELVLHCSFDNFRSPILTLPADNCINLFFLHLKGRKEQNIIIKFNTNTISCYFPFSREVFTIRNMNNIEIDIQKSNINCELLKCQLVNDILFIHASKNNIICIMIDFYGIPRSVFNIVAQKESGFENMNNIATNELLCVDVRNGSLLSYEFDYKTMISENPSIFQTLLHFTALKDGMATNIFKYVTFDVLKMHWANPIFDEFILTLLQRTDCSTFCELDPIESSFFKKVDFKNIESHEKTTWRNVGQLLNHQPTQVAEIKQLVRDIPSNLLFYGLIQYYVDLLWTQKDPEIPPDFVKHVYPYLNYNVAQTWVAKNMAPFEVLSVKDDEVTEESKWWSKRCNKVTLILSETDEPISIYDQLRLVSKIGTVDNYIIDLYSKAFEEL